MSGFAGPAPHGGTPVGFWTLMFACCAAPVFWTGQLFLGYVISSLACYGADHPTHIAASSALRGALLVFDVIAIVAALAGLAVAISCWRSTEGARSSGSIHLEDVRLGRARFMALWGIFSSIWFLGAIVFSTIGSLVVPLCTP